VILIGFFVELRNGIYLLLEIKNHHFPREIRSASSNALRALSTLPDLESCLSCFFAII
jgi:uncharacterized protein (UPF0147 family)